jgi:cell division protease FtsH
MARQMVCRFGMNDSLGPVTFGQGPSSRFLPWAGGGEARNFSEETARAIDAEVRKVIDREHARARAVLRTRAGVLRSIASELLLRETLQRAELEALARPSATVPSGHPTPHIVVGPS